MKSNLQFLKPLKIQRMMKISILRAAATSSILMNWDCGYLVRISMSLQKNLIQIWAQFNEWLCQRLKLIKLKRKLLILLQVKKFWQITSWKRTLKVCKENNSINLRSAIINLMQSLSLKINCLKKNIRLFPSSILKTIPTKILEKLLWFKSI